MPLAAAALFGAVVLGSAFAAESLLGEAPCALCLLERWPWGIAIGVAVLGLLLPRRPARAALALAGLVVLGGAAIAAVHVGVEAGLWPSPLPECAAPRFSGGSIAERLASMPERPAKPCDEPSYPVPGLPVSIAAMNLIASLAFSAAIGGFLARNRRRRR
jgi:disulfide bond formation protein DsbB